MEVIMAGLAVPLLPDKVDTWKAWAQELNGSRQADFDDFNRRMGLTDHRAWLTQLPTGPAVVVLHDGEGADQFLEKLSKSDHPFDKWFRDSISECHGMDFSTAPPGPELMIDWRAV
jgi:hypothetical protein